MYLGKHKKSQTAKLKLVKKVIKGLPGDRPAEFNFDVKDSEDNIVNVSSIVVEGAKMEITDPFVVPSGSISIQEFLPDVPGQLEGKAFWQLTKVTCAEIKRNGGYIPISIQGDRANNKVSFNALPNKEYKCTFENTLQRNPRIKLIKHIEPKSDKFDRRFDFKLLDENRNEVESPYIQTSDGMGMAGNPFYLQPGVKYAVLETVPKKWALEAKMCTLNDKPIGHEIENGVTQIMAPVGGEIICRFRNRLKIGKLRVVKKTIGGEGDEKFYFQALKGGKDGDPIDLDPIVHHGEVTKKLVVGKYSAKEILKDGFDVKKIVCNGHVDPTPADGVFDGTFHIRDHQETVCTFHNLADRDPPMEDITKLYVKRNLENLLDGPDRSRIQRRLDQQRDGQPERYGSYEARWRIQ